MFKITGSFFVGALGWTIFARWQLEYFSRLGFTNRLILYVVGVIWLSAIVYLIADNISNHDFQSPRFNLRFPANAIAPNSSKVYPFQINALPPHIFDGEESRVGETYRVGRYVVRRKS